MRTINVFIASSAELKQERIHLADLLEDLNQEKYYDLGIKLFPPLWEYCDSSVRKGRKEDEYLAELRKSEICIVLFWKTLGRYTVEELDVAVEEENAGRLPKHVFAYFREPANNISQKLANFKKRFTKKYPSVPQYSYVDIEDLRMQVAKLLKQII